MNSTIAPTTKVIGVKKSVNSVPVLVREAEMKVSGKVIIFSICYFGGAPDLFFPYWKIKSFLSSG